MKPKRELDDVKKLQGTIGVEVLGGISYPVLIKDTPLPAEADYIFSTVVDNQPDAQVHLLFGENRKTIDNVSLGKFSLDNIPALPRGRPQIKIKLQIDASLELTVSTTDPVSGHRWNVGMLDLSQIQPPLTRDPFSIYPESSMAPSKRTPRPGADLRHNLCLSFNEAIQGVEKEIEFCRAQACSACLGSGVSNPGQAIPSPCSLCHGQGQIRSNCRIVLRIPPGIQTGTQLRLIGEGEPGYYGGPQGNLYVVITVADHPLFTRVDNDAHIRLPIEKSFANKGGRIRIPGLEPGKNLLLTLPPKTQNGTKLRLSGEGGLLPSTEGERGDLIVVIETYNPYNIFARFRIRKRLQLIRQALKNKDIEAEAVRKP